MTLDINSARPDRFLPELAQMIWQEDKAVMTLEFGSLENWLQVAENEWPNKTALNCYATTNLAIRGSELYGFVTGFRASEYDRAAVSEKLRQEVSNHSVSQDMADKIDGLYGTPKEGSYYVLDISVATSFQRQGLGRRLFQTALNKAKQAGCTSLCLDVAGDNPAVGFYQNLGMQIGQKSSVADLRKTEAIAEHFHMLIDI